MITVQVPFWKSYIYDFIIATNSERLLCVQSTPPSKISYKPKVLSLFYIDIVFCPVKFICWSKKNVLILSILS